jgi:hypothetical protein
MYVCMYVMIFALVTLHICTYICMYVNAPAVKDTLEQPPSGGHGGEVQVLWTNAAIAGDGAKTQFNDWSCPKAFHCMEVIFGSFTVAKEVQPMNVSNNAVLHKQNNKTETATNATTSASSITTSGATVLTILRPRKEY